MVHKTGTMIKRSSNKPKMTVIFSGLKAFSIIIKRLSQILKLTPTTFATNATIKDHQSL